MDANHSNGHNIKLIVTPLPTTTAFKTTTETTAEVTTTSTLALSTTELLTTTESSSRTIIFAALLLGILLAIAVGAFLAYKFFGKRENPKTLNGKGQKKGSPAKKGRSKKPKKLDEEKSSTMEYEEKKEFSGVLVNV